MVDYEPGWVLTLDYERGWGLTLDYEQGWVRGWIMSEGEHVASLWARVSAYVAYEREWARIRLTGK